MAIDPKIRFYTNQCWRHVELSRNANAESELLTMRGNFDAAREWKEKSYKHDLEENRYRRIIDAIKKGAR